jgi:hypothetical protein
MPIATSAAITQYFLLIGKPLGWKILTSSFDQKTAIGQSRDQHVDRRRAPRLKHRDGEALRIYQVEIRQFAAALPHPDIVVLAADHTDIGKVISTGLRLNDAVEVSDLKRSRKVSIAPRRRRFRRRNEGGLAWRVLKHRYRLRRLGGRRRCESGGSGIDLRDIGRLREGRRTRRQHRGRDQSSSQ